LAEGKMINVMDVGKVYKAARDVYDATEDLAAVEYVIAEQVRKLCVAA
jgi:hypothetical protein